MKINIQSIDFTVRTELHDFVEKKVQKFMRLCDDIISIDVKFKISKAADQTNKCCGMRLIIPGYDLLSNTKSSSFEEAVAKAVASLEKQIAKRKTRNRQLEVANSGHPLQQL